MKPAAIVSIDLGKQTFHVVAHDEHGHELHRKKLSRKTYPKYFANLPPCIVAMEACGGSHFMAREMVRFGHQPKLIAAQHVRPYVKSNKNDYADAEAICEAAGRPSMRFVAPKSEAQQSLAMLGAVRESYIKDRTATSNRIHSMCLEVGIGLSPGYKSIRELPVVLEDCTFHPAIKSLLMELHSHFIYLDQKLKVMDRQVECQAAEDDLAHRLMTIPCVGPVISTALAAELGDGRQFKCGRDYAASIGLVPKQHTTGGKPVLLGISKRGDRNQRRLLIQCARVYLINLERQKGQLADWVRQLLSSHHANKVACALANKIARIAWAIAANHREYDAGPSAMNA
ncbi:IS110 family RNA-guided transposase [Pseudomonas paeninsulae]|uniref:IS110 family transposase n=1 Tax=Pseudomonas paeninsulae TaxID=3110772 RepID=UPI002D783B4F|nr:IS110 family transposase [Pseudomonas sp. IT1137]